MQPFDVRQELVRRSLEEAVIVKRIVVIRRPSRLPVLSVDGARKTFQAVLDRCPSFQLFKK
jgi:hypothetical protein